MYKKYSQFYILLLLFTLNFKIFPFLISFVTGTKTGWQLFSTEPNGSNTKQLSSGEYDVREPDWFPERDRIAFTNTAGDAFVIDATSAKVTDTIASEELYFWQASVNKDGSILYLVAGKPKEADQTFIGQYNFSNKKLSTVLHLRTPMYHLDVSPVNDDIVFANTICGSDCEHIIQEIWLREGNGRNTYQLHLLNAISRYPKWHPNGKEIVFDSEVGRTFTLFTQKVGLKEPLKIIKSGSAHDNYTQPSISPDGKQLLYLKNGHLFICPVDNPDKSKKIIPFPDKPETRIKDPAW